MQVRTQPPKELFESHLHDTLDSLYAEIYSKSRGKERSLHSSQKSEKQDKHEKNKKSSVKSEKINEENVQSTFKPLVPTTQNFISFDKKVVYDFDVFEMEGQSLIATIVDNIYYLHCLNTDSGKMDLIKQEKVELVLSTERVTNFNEQDSFYSIKFAQYYPDEEQDDIELMLAFTGKAGIIYLVNIEKDFHLKYLLGHVNEVYDICAPSTRWEPQWRNLLFSCSRDTSVNLWNIRTGVQIACFREITQVPADSISICCHYNMKSFAVSHFDGCLKVWNIDEAVIEKINQARQWKGDPQLFKHLDVRKPYCLTRDLHCNTCDNVQFYGDFIVSKDTEGNIVISSLSKLGAQVIHEVEYQIWEPIWFVKFGIDPQRKLLYIGNDNGEIFFWKLATDSAIELAKLSLPVQKLVRKTFLTSDCKYIIMSTDDGKLWYLQLESIPL